MSSLEMTLSVWTMCMQDNANQPDHSDAQPKPAIDRRDPSRRRAEETEWLAPDPPPIPDRIQKKIEPRGAKLPPIPSVPVKVKVDYRWARMGLIAAGALAVALVATLLLRPSPFDHAARARWVALCEGYAQWFAPLSRSLTEHDKTVLHELELDAAVSILVDAERFDPRVIADRPQGNLAALGLEPPSTARTREAVDATARALDALNRVESLFSEWPTAMALESHHVMLVDHGWTRVAEVLEHTLNQAPPHGRGPVGPSLIAMQNLEAHTTPIAKMVDQLEADLAALEPFNDPVFDALAHAVDRLDGQAPAATALWHSHDNHATKQLIGLAEALGPLGAFASQFRTLAESEQWDAIDHANFRQTGRAYAMLAEGQTADQELFRAWLEQAPDFRYAQEQDWRPDWAQAQHQSLAAADDILRRLLADAPGLAAQTLTERLTQTRTRIDRLLDAPFTAGTVRELDVRRGVLERDVQELVAATHRLERNVTAARQAADSFRQTQPLADDPAQRSPAVEAAWQAERQRLADQLEQSSSPENAAAELEAARKILSDLTDPASENALPFPKRFETHGQHPTTAALLDAIHAASLSLREDTLTRAFQYGLSAADRTWPATRSRYTQQLQELDAAAETASRLGTALAGAYPLNDPARSSHPQGLAGETTAWPQADWWNQPTLREPAEAVIQQLSNLSVLRSMSRTDLATAITLADEPAVVFAAWRAWCRADGPRNTQTLIQSQSFEPRLLDMANTVAPRDPARAQALRDEITAARPRHWQQAMSQASTAPGLQAVAALAQAMDVDADALPAELRFNLLLAQTQSALADLPTSPGPQRDAQVITMTRTLVDQLQPLAKDAATSSWLSSLQALTADDADHREFLAQAGPARRGWAVTSPDDGATATFSRDGWALTFVRIDPERGRPFYLCTTELPVGLALDAAAWYDAQSELAALMPPRGDGDIRKGPRSWVYSNHSIALNPKDWLGGTSHYAPRLTPSPPTAQHPINYVTAEGASYLTALLGCRLPTTTQWTAAVRAYPLPPRVVPNLRDTTWLGHAKHTAELIRNGEPHADWANSDTFRPTPAPIAPASNQTQDKAIDDDPVGNYHPINDETLWFTPAAVHADDSTEPEHLIGNVAELVVARAIDPDVLLNTNVPIEERRRAFRQTHKTDFAVMGGSALSSALLNPKTPQRFNIFSGSRGYADVGLRLAFEVPFASPGERAEALLRNPPFLKPTR